MLLTETGERTLLSYLAEELLHPIKRRGWLAEEHVRLDEYLRQAQLGFETGCLLGHTFRDRLAVLAELISEPGREAETVVALVQSGQAQLPDGHQRDLLDLFFKPEAEAVFEILRLDGRSKAAIWSEFPKAAKVKLKMAEAAPRMPSALHKGIGFGSQQPEWLEKLVSERPQPETWRCFRADSPYLPASPPLARPLSVRRTEAIATVRPYLEQFRPDLLAKLGLWPKGGTDAQLRFRAIMARR